MQLSRKQWERLDMMIENPSREGIDTIILTNTKEGWRINCSNSKVTDKETDFILEKDGGRRFQSEEYNEQF